MSSQADVHLLSVCDKDEVGVSIDPATPCLSVHLLSWLPTKSVSQPLELAEAAVNAALQGLSCGVDQTRLKLQAAVCSKQHVGLHAVDLQSGLVRLQWHVWCSCQAARTMRVLCLRLDDLPSLPHP